jgi:hypothetical protein
MYRSALKNQDPRATFPFFRVRQLERIIVDRYGEKRLPDDDEGRDILRPMADHLAQINPIRIRPWAAAWMPGLPAADVDDLIASREALIAECGKTALHWNADALAHEIGLDDETRTKAKAWTIGAVDCDKAEREERRKITRAAAARARRAAAGATPRAQSITATKPWIKDGFSTRRTWERHGKRPRVANSRPAILSSSTSVTNLRHAHSDTEGRSPLGLAIARATARRSIRFGFDLAEEGKEGRSPSTFTLETDAPVSPQAPPCRASSSFDQPEPESVVSELLASYGAVFSGRDLEVHSSEVGDMK